MASLVVCALARPAAAIQDADQYYGQQVAEVRFEVEGQSERPNLTSVVGVRAGEVLTREQVRDSLGHLAEYYDQVGVNAATEAGRLIITFRLVPRYPVNSVQIGPGDTGVPPGLLRTELSQRFVRGSTDVQVEDVEAAARRILTDAGYLTPEISARKVVEPNENRTTLIVDVNAGPLAVVRRTYVRGATLISSADVIRRTQTEVGRPYRRRDIDTRLTEIEDDLRARGYYEAQLAVTPTPVEGGVELEIVIDVGPRVELRVEPRADVPGDIDELVPIRRLRSADRDLLEDAKARIEAALHRTGYANGTATFREEPSPDGSVLFITFTIDKGPRHFVDRIDLQGLESAGVPVSTIRDRLAIKPGDVFDPEKFTAGVEGVLELFRPLGYYQSSAEPARDLVPGRSTPDQAWVVLHPRITLGPRGLVSEVRFVFQGEHALPESDLRSRLSSRVGQPYQYREASLDFQALMALYRERGYVSARLELGRGLSPDGTAVTLQFTINEGPQVLIQRVTVTGNEQLSEQEILDVIGLQPGQPYNTASVEAARQRLLEMGVFRRVEWTPEDRLAGETVAHLVFNVLEQPAISGAFGGGLEGERFARSVAEGFEDRIEFRPRATFEITRRNIGGRNRALSFFARGSFRPRADTGQTGFAFPEHRVTTTYRERRAFHSNTDLLVSLTSEQAVRLAYTSLRRGVNAEFLRRPTRRLSVSGRYGLDFTHLSNVRIGPDERPTIDRLFPQVRLSYFASGVTWDDTDNVLAPTRGSYFSADGEIAGRAIGSEVGYLKTFFQGKYFRRLLPQSPTVLGLRLQVGLARGFQRIVETVVGGIRGTEVVEDLPVSQRFFTGGGSTVRGFQQDRLGIFDPDCNAAGGANCVIDPVTGLSFGGNGLIVANAELRRTLTKLFDKDLGIAAFIDGGNVFARASEVDLSRIRGAMGFGVRWASPLGPLRLDFGFKSERLVIADKRERGWEYHLSIGEAY